MRRKYTILFFSHSAALYGAERSLLDLLMGIDRTAFHPIVALPEEGPLADKLKDEGVDVRITGHQNWMGGKYFYLAAILRFVANIVTFVKLRLWLKAPHVALIYTNTSATPMGGLLAQSLGIPHIWHIREFIPTGTGGNFYYGNRLSFWFIMRSSSTIVCNSHQLEKKLAPYLPAEQMVVVHNGVLSCQPENELAKSPPTRKNELQLAMVGSVGPNKGIADGIKAVAALNDMGINVRLKIAGDGLQKNKDRLQDLAKDLEVTNQIDWLGYIDDPSSLYRQVHIVLVCSRWESFGRVAVEAGAQGCPVIATNRGGLLEVIEEHKTGFFYEPGDIETLTINIVSLLENSARYQEISANAQQSVYSRFTTNQYVANMTKVIENTLSEATVA